MDYKIPEPKENPIASLVIYFKVLKGVEFDDRAWDKIHFSRSMKAAKDLLDICQDYEQSKRCIDEMSDKFRDLDVSWSFETIVKHAHEWKQRRGKKNDIESRKRFFDALAKQRADGQNMGKGGAVTGREILGPLGNFEILQDNNGGERGSGSNPNGSTGGTVRKDPLETKEAGGLG